ncbi:hypothetical protein CVD25_21065 [Bacillus canaveralius]|uniref:Uncharacterized protein n=1 Tax=Bacillus canaveralius TaxID=1403243 RepID=A0A2N5GGT3_9BACI|nr:hypothetical protein [Bacillus canaveralius]PLR79967.1 hypothetical protein CU635_20300 [Bacillus canaveralius]PLR89513.1 hypothetical protein CVD25_21065 [Bacillus canaveralius]
MSKQAFIKKQMEKQLSELYDKKVTEITSLQGEKQILRSTIGKVIGGQMEHRNQTFFHEADGTLLKVNTGDNSSVNVEIVRSFNSLDYAERVGLQNQNPNAYKLLKADLVEVNGTDKVKSLLISDGVMYQEFLHKMEEPVKPNLSGLSIEDSTKVLREYDEAKANHEAQVNAYNTDKQAYLDGTLNRKIDEIDEQIKEAKAEIGEA